MSIVVSTDFLESDAIRLQLTVENIEFDIRLIRFCIALLYAAANHEISRQV
jgi:hypothetical protein